MQPTGSLTIESIVEHYRQPLTRAAYHLCGDREAADDIVQDTFIDAYKGFEGLREPEKAGAWLYAILRRKAVAHRRARKPETALLDENIAAPEDAEAMVQRIVIEQMSRLNDTDREILAGKYLLGLTYKELSESLGIKEGAIRVRCLRAKERLGEILRGVGLQVPGKR